MAASNKPAFVQGPPICVPVTFTSADTTTKKDIYTADATTGGRLFGVICSSDDTASVRCNIYMKVSGTSYLLGQVTVAAGAGTGTGDVASVNLMDRTKLPGLQPDGSLLVPAGGIVQVACNATMTSSKTLTLVPQAENY